MRLFKFVGSAGAVQNMARGSLKFTPIEELNDPSELTPVMDRPAVRASLEALRNNGMTQDQFEWLQCQGAILDLLSPGEKVIPAPRTLEEANRILSIAVYDDLDYMEKKLFATIQNIRSRVGILSLSERYDSLPMWAHYANLAKGFVAVFNNLERTFNGDNTGSLNIPKRVIYGDQFTGMTFDPSTQDRLLFSKLSDWSYEREWRVVTALNACRQDSSLFLRDVDQLHLTGVIFGWRAPKDEVSSLGIELKRVNPKAKLVPAVLNGGKVVLGSSF
ncbi:DUF2971 domain-containing protein [Acidiphilium sp. AL]|uniref:DUF2971 domain-containing protein n=1 Tax=Acidiphilium sp. AL TaxID=2871704 RepID=UPI0021CB3DBC|nr:DUF2971 domain-containing protein [Acidiphilium sp. AL]MCU4161633.1 DUF2971 domain-containing protein [Acidiphilium sp. AL]